MLRTIFLSTLVLLPTLAWSLDAGQAKRFEQIQKMTMADLTVETERLLERKYSDLDWDQFRFPDFVFTSDSVEMGYRVAVVAPELLSGIDAPGTEQGIPCYCFCEAMGHRDLLACFLKDGKLNNGYDDHAAGCNICFGQAMLAFLWQDAGATKQEILEGMKVRFARLLELREE